MSLATPTMTPEDVAAWRTAQLGNWQRPRKQRHKQREPRIATSVKAVTPVVDDGRHRHRWRLPPGAGLGAPYVQSCECGETREMN